MKQRSSTPVLEEVYSVLNDQECLEEPIRVENQGWFIFNFSDTKKEFDSINKSFCNKEQNKSQ